MSNTDERLNAFAPVSKAEWLAKVEKDLKGKPIDRLRTTNAGGLVLEPLYTAEDFPDPAVTGEPGVYPYVRGSAPVGGWRICQQYGDPRVQRCKSQIDEDFQKGAEALWLRAGPRYGCRILTVDDLDEALAPVDLTATPVYLDGGSDTLAVAAGLLAVAERRGVRREVLIGGFAFDPIGLLALDGRIQGGLRARLAELRDLAAWCSNHASGLRAVNVSNAAYDGGGASAEQELAYTLATGIEYLRQLTEAGLSVEAAARQIGFSYAVSGNFFVQIAKLRAARALWSRIVVASGGEPAAAAMHLHVRTSPFTKTARDPWVNMLRVTAECTAAVLGGAQTIATSPFDAVLGTPEGLARRVARNTQVVLREESHLDAVADPAGGSWFVESLTDELARSAWKQMQVVEEAGGIIAALGSGTLIDAIQEVAARRRDAVSRRKAPIVGVTEFPNASEAPLERESVSDDEVRRLVRVGLDELDVGAHRDSLLSLAHEVNDVKRELGSLTAACVSAATGGTDIYSIAAVLQHGQPDYHVEPIVQWRAADAWESLRTRTELNADRPSAFLANLGAIAAHKARSTWAQNLLAAAGITASPNDGFEDPAALGPAWKESGASLTVICGSDADYEAMLEPAVSALKAAGCPIVLVAGRPGENASTLREAGVSDFVFVGADLLRVMTEVVDSLGAAG